MTGERVSQGGVFDQGNPFAAAHSHASRSADGHPSPRSSDATQTTSPPDQKESGGSSATSVKTRPSRPRLDRLPPWNVLLHNDEKNEMGYVIETIIELTALNPHDALIKMIEAHKTGVALLLTVHREYAELLQEQFASKRLTVTIEPNC